MEPTSAFFNGCCKRLRVVLLSGSLQPDSSALRMLFIMTQWCCKVCVHYGPAVWAFFLPRLVAARLSDNSSFSLICVLLVMRHAVFCCATVKGAGFQLYASIDVARSFCRPSISHPHCASTLLS
jgi:hypothetical protein